jgi:hypothetical protein
MLSTLQVAVSALIDSLSVTLIPALLILLAGIVAIKLVNKILKTALNKTKLEKAAVPEGIKPFPVLGISLKAEKSLPDWDDFAVFCPEEDDCDLFEEERAMLGAEIPEECSKLLGWPDTIQNSVFEECAAKDGSSLGDWILLFQLDTVTDGEFELMFGDCGRIYLCMKKADLAARRFDRIHLTLQCY